MLADRKMKLRYLEPMVVVRKLCGDTYILAELDGSVWQNRVAAFQVIPYLSRKKIDFTREVQGLLDASEKDLKELAAEREEIPLENTQIYNSPVTEQRDYGLQTIKKTERQLI